jgi:transcription elongation factor GreA-like protein
MNMGHYAKIENEIVVQVNVVEEDFFKANPDQIHRSMGTNLIQHKRWSSSSWWHSFKKKLCRNWLYV